MTALRVLLSRVLDLFVGRRRDRELTEEIEAHLDLLTEEHLGRGMSREDARAAARRAFGGIEQVKEAYRDQRGLPLVDALGQDLRFGARLLAKDRWFTLAAVIALALGIGITNTVFTVVNALTRGLPVDNPDRIVRLSTRDAAGRELRVSYRDFEDWRAATRAFDGIAAFVQTAMTVSEQERASERFSGSYLSANAFHLLDEKPLLGRDFRPEDDRPSAAPVALLGYRVWQNRYGGDPAVVGRTIAINGVPSVVIGVMRDGFRFPVVADMWQPLGLLPNLENQKRDARVLQAFGRLAGTTELREAQSELDSIAARLTEDYPDTNRGIRAAVLPFLDASAGYPIFLALMGSVGFVLLIACANIANLLLARAAHRSREIAIRLSQGATRWRIVRQLLVESGLLAMLAGALGFGLSVVGLRVFSLDVKGINFPYHIQWTMDGRVFTFFAVVSLGTAVVFGLLPALHVSKANVSEVLKEGGRTATGGLRARRWTGVLLTAELAFTLVLLAGAGLMVRSFLALYRADLVADTSNVLAMGLTLPNQKYPTPAHRTAFYERLEERLGAIPAISSATLVSNVPFAPTPVRELSIDGRVEIPGERRPTITYVTIGSRYFDTLGLRLLRGRDFTATDGTPGHESAIVNQRFVSMYFQGEDPIGGRIRVRDPNAPGVMPDLTLRGTRKPSEALREGVPGSAEALSEGGPPWITIVGVSPSLRQQQAAGLQEIDPDTNKRNRSAHPVIRCRAAGRRGRGRLSCSGVARDAPGPGDRAAPRIASSTISARPAPVLAVYLSPVSGSGKPTISSGGCDSQGQKGRA